eukprot:1673623-Alexandrium_andersonii.AAC.1
MLLSRLPDSLRDDSCGRRPQPNQPRKRLSLRESTLPWLADLMPLIYPDTAVLALTLTACICSDIRRAAI